jgi:hypothetical protein
MAFGCLGATRIAVNPGDIAIFDMTRRRNRGLKGGKQIKKLMIPREGDGVPSHCSLVPLQRAKSGKLSIVRSGK